MSRFTYVPSYEEFARLAREGNLIPVYREILADLETPVSAFLKIDDGEYSYLLESVEGGEKWARYSFLGSRPSLLLRGGDGCVDLIREGSIRTVPAKTDPLTFLKQIMGDYHPVKVEGLPRFFGGAVGYVGYEVIRYFERVPYTHKEGLNLPEFFFLITDTLLIFDRLSHTIKVVASAHIRDGDVKKAYEEATSKIEEIIERLKTPLPKRRSVQGKGTVHLSSNCSQAEFHRMVRRSKEYILAGDIFQVVLSQRFSAQVRADPFDVYRALRLINPSPYMYYLRLGNFTVVGSSPEILVRCEEGEISLRPIAGTRMRGRTDEEDQALAGELLSDSKERAEHIMLVDLGRNDVGRVSRIGRVSVDCLMTIERYSHVMHLVSHVRGELDPRRDIYDLFRACFPAGTVSGAPKIRAMEIIEELEPVRRGLYAGAVGYFSFSGNMDTCIAIRTILIHDHQAYVQAGAGLVADSDPEREYQETVDKAQAMIAALRMAEQGLGEEGRARIGLGPSERGD